MDDFIVQGNADLAGKATVAEEGADGAVFGNHTGRHLVHVERAETGPHGSAKLFQDASSDLGGSPDTVQFFGFQQLTTRLQHGEEIGGE